MVETLTAILWVALIGVAGGVGGGVGLGFMLIRQIDKRILELERLEPGDG